MGEYCPYDPAIADAQNERAQPDYGPEIMHIFWKNKVGKTVPDIQIIFLKLHEENVIAQSLVAMKCFPKCVGISKFN